MYGGDGFVRDSVVYTYVDAPKICILTREEGRGRNKPPAVATAILA